MKSSAAYTGHYGADPHLSGNASQVTLSRGVRLEKAMEPHSLIVFQMNGQPLPNIHGGPARLLYPGWAGSASHKWVTRIWIRDKEHDGQGMTGTSYRVPRVPMVPGGKADDANMQILESMPVRSIITSPANGTELAGGARQISLRGAAWAGDKTVRQVDVSIDYGQSWMKANLAQPKNRFDWQRWTASVSPADARLLRDLVARDRFRRPDAAACRRQLEPAGLWRQCAAPRRRPHQGLMQDRA